MKERLQKICAAIWSGITIALKSRIFIVLVFMVCAVVVGPFVYVTLKIPEMMRPVNYYDFLNSFLLMGIIVMALLNKDANNSP